MTVSSLTNKASFSANGSTTVFAYNFKIFADADLEVISRAADGTETIKTLSTHYNVSGAGSDSGGNVTFTSGNTPANGTSVIIRRSLALTQSTDYVENDTFAAENHEDALDRLTFVTQSLQEQLDRTFKVSKTTTITTPEVVEAAADRASKALVFSSDGNALEIGPTASQITTAQTYATNAANSASAAAADVVLTNADVVTTGASATLSANYATKIDGAVTGSDYASKAWAVGGTGVTTTSARGAAKEWATSTGAAVDTSEFSSKEYSQGTTVTTGSSKQWALGGASFDVDTVVAGGEFSAKKYAANAAASAAQAASGQIYSTVVNQTGAALSPALSADGTYYLCDTSSNDITVTLPAIGTAEGTKYAFQKTSASNSLIFQRSGSDTLNGSASDITITDVNAQIQFVSDDNSPDNWVGVQMSQITVGAGLTKVGSVVSIGDDSIVPSMVQGTVNAQTGTTYTLVIGDAFKTVTMSNASANTLTIPPNSSVAFAVGDRIDIVMLAAGVTSVVGGSGVTVNGVSTGTGAIAAQYGAVSCLKIATDTWLLMGNHGGVA